MRPSPTTALERHLSADAAAVLAQRMTSLSLDAGQPLMTGGLSSTALHLVLAGTLDVTLEEPGGRIVVGHIGPDTWVGEAGFLDGKGATANVVATTPAQLLCLSRKDFHALKTHHPAAAAELLRALCALLAERIHHSSSGLLDAVGTDADTLELHAPSAEPGALAKLFARLFGGRSHG